MKVLCADGKVRTTVRLLPADTFFSRPAAVRVKGRTVTGFVTCRGDTFKFTPNADSKNADLLPPWEWELGGDAA